MSTPSRNARYETPSAAHKQLGLWVRGVGYHQAQQARPLESWKRRLGDYAAVYLLRGQGWFHSAPTGNVELKAGTLVWLFPTVEHGYGPLQDTWDEQWVIFNGALAEEFERQGYLNPAQPFVNVGQDMDVLRLFKELEGTFLEGGPLSVPLAGALTYQLIIRVYGLARGLFGDTSTQSDALIAAALRLIDTEAFAGTTPETIAARLHIGYSTLRRRFRVATGQGVKDYMLRVQLRKAKELLALSKLPIERVATECGFADAAYFSRVFRQSEGFPPSAFRTQQSLVP